MQASKFMKLFVEGFYQILQRGKRVMDNVLQADKSEVTVCKVQIPCLQPIWGGTIQYLFNDKAKDQKVNEMYMFVLCAW